MPINHFRFVSIAALVFFLSACSLLPSPGQQSTPESLTPGVGEAPAVESAGGDVNTMLVVAIGLVITGAILIGVAAVFLMRKRRRGRRVSSTSHLSVPLEILPDQAALKEGAYVILRAKSSAASGNVYAGRGTTPLQLCPHCQTQVEGETERFCRYCGADLLDITRAYPKYVIRETADAQVLGPSSRLVALQLRHPGLLLPVDFFTDANSNPVRYYSVEPPYTAAVDLPVPQPADRVLPWGADLARGLEYLHQHHVVLRWVDLEHIVIDNSHARLIGIDNAHIVPQDMRSKAEVYFKHNVQALSQLLLGMLTGSTEVPTNADFAIDAPEGVITLLLQAQQSDIKTGMLAGALEQAARALHAPDKVDFQIGQLTDVGQVRSLNEDSIFALDLSEQFRSLGVPVGVIAVADGMGGHAAGDVASQLTIKMVAQHAAALNGFAKGSVLPDAGDWLKRTMAMANYTVYSERASADNDMGCTLVLALVIGGNAVIGNIGDSRAYWLSQDGIKQITTDHSLVERLVEVGQITQAEARDHPQRNIIYRVVGDKPEPEFDRFEQVLLPGEALLLCSDGLSGMLTDEEMWQIWRATSSPQATCARLVDAANQAGGTDNISVTIVQIAAADVT